MSENYCRQVFEAIRLACNKWQINQYLTESEFNLVIEGAPGQAFRLDFEDDGDEIILFVDEASFHTHFGPRTTVQQVIEYVKPLLTGEAHIETTRKRGTMIASQVITNQPGFNRVTASVSFHPKYWFAPEVLTEYRNSVQLKSDTPEP